jgi:hypothetical protein
MEETPLDTAFAREAGALYRERVAPALLEIGELEEERGIRRQLRKQATSGESAPDLAATAAGFALGLAATGYDSLPALGAVVGGLSASMLSSA